MPLSYVLMNVNMGSEERVFSEVRNVANVKECHKVYGAYDLIAKVEADSMEELKQIIVECRKVGLFLVPVGELGYWAKQLMAGGPSKLRKSEWANEAVRRIRVTKAYETDIFKFMRDIEQFHIGEIHRLATDVGQPEAPKAIP